jgi:drug/metabolite transporter (DMT)-like permease
MTWFLLALIGPFLWSVGNYIDKILIEKYFKTRSMGSLLIISSLIGLIIAPIIFILKPSVINIPIYYALFMLLSAVLFVIYVWTYLKAMEEDETSIVVPFYQLIPVFAFILGYFFLGETITHLQFFAMLLILAGATILSFEIDEENKFKFRKRTVFFMLISSFVSAIESVIFKYVLLTEDFWATNFWSFLWIGIIGLFLLFSIKLYKKEFIYIIKNNSSRILGLNILNEILTSIGSIAMTYAFILAPITLVLLANAYQPVFVLIIGVLLTIFFPKLITEKIKLKHIIQKVLVIGIMLFGTYLLFV